MLLMVFTVNRVNGQNLILNGSFEINNASVGVNYVNISNTVFNNLVPYCHSFGNYGIDLITTDTWDGFAQQGDWYVGIEGSSIDLFSMELSDSLIQGDTYQLVFYDNARESNHYTSCFVEIGLSEQKDDFGTLIYSTLTTALYNEWRLQYYFFSAPNNGKFITVRSKSPTSGACWVKIDNFCLSQGEQCLELPKFEMPNVFTPNNDGINDIFKPVVFKGMKAGKLAILNRWGTVLFEIDDLTQGWNGMYENKPVSEGVYFWKAEYTSIFDETQTEYGFFSVVR